jgi:hypothetical protein
MMHIGYRRKIVMIQEKAKEFARRKLLRIANVDNDHVYEVTRILFQKYEKKIKLLNAGIA